jgi:hypothetical protein
MPPAKPCDFCDAHKGGKDYREFGIRACLSCIQYMTISDYRLSHDYDLPRNLLQSVRNSTTSMWSFSSGRSMKLNFYLVEDVIQILADHHGCQPTFKDISFQRAREETLQIASTIDFSKQIKNQNFLANCSFAFQD